MGLIDLSIDDGAVDACPVRVRVDWRDRLPASIIASVGPAADASDAVRAIALTSNNPARIAGASVAPAIVEVLSTWPADIADLRIHDGIASASRPFGSPAAASELVGCLRRVIAAMEPRYGAYR